MPQPISTLDYSSMVQPITSAISSGISHVSEGVKGGIDMYNTGVVREQNAKTNQDLFSQIQGFLSPVKDLNVDWQSLAPKTDEPAKDYQERLKTEMPGIVSQLDRLGFDPNELAQATQIPGITMESLNKLRDKRLAQRMVTPDTKGAYSDVQAGKKTLEQINQGRGTNLTQADYERVAGLQQPIAPAAQTQNQQGSYLPPVTDMTAIKTMAAGQKPMTEAEAQDTTISSPASYETAQKMALQMTPEGQKAYEPILQSAASREAARVAKEPAQTPTGLYTGMAEKGLPLTDLSKQIGTAMKDEAGLDFKAKQNASMLDYKKNYTKMRQKEQDNSLLKALLSYNMYSGRMKKAYGDAGEKAAQRLYELSEDREKLNNEYQNSLTLDPDQYRRKNPGKPLPDPISIQSQIMQTDDEIDRIKSTIPKFDRMMEDFASRPATLRMPEWSSSGGDETPVQPPAAQPATKPSALPPGYSETRVNEEKRRTNRSKYGY